MNSHAYPAGIRNVDFRSSAKKERREKGLARNWRAVHDLAARGESLGIEMGCKTQTTNGPCSPSRVCNAAERPGPRPNPHLLHSRTDCKQVPKRRLRPYISKKGANSRGLKRHSAQFLLGRFAIDVGAKFLGTLIRPSRGQRRWRAGRWRRRRPRSAILRRRAG